MHCFTRNPIYENLEKKTDLKCRDTLYIFVFVCIPTQEFNKTGSLHEYKIIISTVVGFVINSRLSNRKKKLVLVSTRLYYYFKKNAWIHISITDI